MGKKLTEEQAIEFLEGQIRVNKVLLAIGALEDSPVWEAMEIVLIRAKTNVIMGKVSTKDN